MCTSVWITNAPQWSQAHGLEVRRWVLMAQDARCGARPTLHARRGALAINVVSVMRILATAGCEHVCTRVQRKAVTASTKYVRQQCALHTSKVLNVQYSTWSKGHIDAMSRVNFCVNDRIFRTWGGDSAR